MTMFLEKVRSEGLAHLSYIVGHNGRAAVIDPRRDCGVYLDIAREHDAVITHIFETHRNEDYVIGSAELARRTGARILHGAALDFEYGEPVRRGDAFNVGSLRLEVLETPGHTFESISIALYDEDVGGGPVGVFTGDALFIGDVGRTDFFPDRAEEVAGLLYDSIFETILPLGDDVILYPAHGAGSVCGSGMAEREFSTLGKERKTNAALLVANRKEFVANKLAETHYQPGYFRRMEEYNQKANAPQIDEIPRPKPMTMDEFLARKENGAMQILDTRSPEAFAGTFIPGSLAVPLDMVPAYAGYFLDYGKPIGLVVENTSEVQTAVRRLLRIGYDDVCGYLTQGVHAWETSGQPFDTIAAVHVDELVRRIEENEPFTLLDVRKLEEVEQGILPGAKHVFLGHLPDHLDEIPRDKPVTTFCGSGRRAIIAASILKQHGFEKVEDALGSMAACAARGCPIETGGR